jgi:hypothetical protein
MGHKKSKLTIMGIGRPSKFCQQKMIVFDAFLQHIKMMVGGRLLQGDQMLSPGVLKNLPKI